MTFTSMIRSTHKHKEARKNSSESLTKRKHWDLPRSIQHKSVHSIDRPSCNQLPGNSIQCEEKFLQFFSQDTERKEQNTKQHDPRLAEHVEDSAASSPGMHILELFCLGSNPTSETYQS